MAPCGPPIAKLKNHHLQRRKKKGKLGKNQENKKL
jgi:hypothetical protein